MMTRTRTRMKITTQIQLALGLLTSFVEGWSIGDAVYFTFITGLTIGYGDLVPRQTFTRVLAIGIGYFGLFVTGVIAAIAVIAARRPRLSPQGEHPRLEEGTVDDQLTP